MDDSFAGEFNATQTASGVAATGQLPETIVSVLIKQVKECTESHFQMWGMNFGVVACAAIVRSIDTSSTKITYLLEDHTGQIEAHYWLEEGGTEKCPDVMINNYAKVHGCLRNQGGTNTLIIFSMVSITDPNEVCTHILEALNARYRAEEFQKKESNGEGFNHFGLSGSTSAAGGGGLDGQQNSGGGLQGKQLVVFQAIKNYDTEEFGLEGISRKDLQKKFKHISEHELNSTLDFLISEGHIYASIDPDHFLCTDC